MRDRGVDMSRSLALRCISAICVVVAVCAPAAAQPLAASSGSQARKCTPMQEGKEMVREILGFRNRCTQAVSTFGGKSGGGNAVKRGDSGNAEKRKPS
ncbi:hypothetical protein [Novosphingobium sp.]|uniref:hypothetical protein n=1 Tax=Novosphingobium sp. TaxID=1874826 RepID=UPI00286BF271|nr:hypothetical protein [Novosphingobium sp.]